MHMFLLCRSYERQRQRVVNAAIDAMSLWCKPLSLADAVHQLEGTFSLRRIYNALVVIRTNYSKGTESLTALRHQGGACFVQNLI